MWLLLLWHYMASSPDFLFFPSTTELSLQMRIKVKMDNQLKKEVVSQTGWKSPGGTMPGNRESHPQMYLDAATASSEAEFWNGVWGGRATGYKRFESK